MPFLRLFRVVNLPTVPGDVLVGAAVVVATGRICPCANDWVYIVLVAAASCALYLFGLVDNDIVGAATDKGRPIPDGEISLGAARIARLVCIVLGLGCIVAGGPRLVAAMGTALALVLVIMRYNRTKRPLLMGLCRGFNVLMGASAMSLSFMPRQSCAVVAVVALWTVYITAVTKYSEGEETDPARKRRVGALIGGIVYLQLAALIVCALVKPSVNPLLIAGAVLLVALRIVKALLPKVGAS